MQIKDRMRVPYALRHIPGPTISKLLRCPDAPCAGDIVLAEVEKISKNANLELINGRRCALHEGDVIAAVFGNRYATLQFEGYARSQGSHCDLLSMGGLCGIAASKHAKVADATKLHLLGALGDEEGRPLRMANFRLAFAEPTYVPRVLVICGSSMDAGKTHTAASAIMGLRSSGNRVAGIKLTGTATGKDTWNMLDAGACVALDFVDGGLPSTYLCGVDELTKLYSLLIGRATTYSVDWVVIEIADGLLQRETATLLQTRRFTATVDAWVFAAGDPMAAESGVRLLRNWGIEPIAISGLLTMSPLNIREAEAATGVNCIPARDLQAGALNELLAMSSRTTPMKHFAGKAS
jgi:hypothetical protein